MEINILNIPIPEDGPICDFCSSPAVAWNYLANNSLASSIIGSHYLMIESIGNWAACEKCAAIIEMGNRDKLVSRSFDSLPEENKIGIPDDYIRTIITKIQTGFWTNRCGSRERIRGQA